MLKRMPKVFYGFLGEQMNLQQLIDFLFLSEQKASAFLNHFCASLSLIFKKRLKISMCES